MRSKLTVLGVVTALLISGSLAFAAIPSMAAGNAADDREISECTVIDESGRYTVTNDITNQSAQTCIDIRTDDVTLDGNGHTIDGVDTNGRGINTNGANVTVTDVTVTGFEYGVANFGDLRLANSTLTENTVGLRMKMASASVVDNTIAANSNAGVEIGTSDQGHDVSFEDNDIVDNGGAGIESFYSTFSMTDNRIAGNGDGGVVGGDTYVESTNNVVADNNGSGIATGLGGVNSTGDTIANNTGNGISVGGTVVVDDSTIENNGGNGVRVLNSGMNTGGISVTDSEVLANGGDGIYVEAGAPTELTVSEIHGSVIADNDGLGVNNEETVVVNATGNDWDSDDGPGSADDDAPFADPVTGALADGSGDEVSEHPEKPGVSNVHFTTESPEDDDGDGEDGEDDQQNDNDEDQQNDNDEENGEAEPDGEDAYQVDLATGEVIETLGDDEADFYGQQGRLLQAKSLTADGDLTRSHGVPQGMATVDGLSYSAVSYDAETGEMTVEVSLDDDSESDTTVTLAAYELPGDTTEFQRDRADGQELVAHQTVMLSPGESITLTIDVDG